MCDCNVHKKLQRGGVGWGCALELCKYGTRIFTRAQAYSSETRLPKPLLTEQYDPRVLNQQGGPTSLVILCLIG